MLSRMMSVPLSIVSLIRHADRWHGDTAVVSREPDGGIFRYTWSAAHRRVRQLAKALAALGIRGGARVGTLAWNTHRHLDGVLRRVRHGRRAQHRQPAPVSRSDNVDPQPRRGRSRVLRSRLCFAGPRVDAALSRGARLGGAVRTVATACGPARRIGLRGLAGCAGQRFRATTAGREQRRRPVLHVRHHGQSQRSGLFPPLDRAACLHACPARLHVHFGPRDRIAGGAAVPRQCLGPALHHGARRRASGAARPSARRTQPACAAGNRRRHLQRGRAHGMDGLAGLPGIQRCETQLPAPHRGGRLRLFRIPDGALRPLRRGDHPRLGHDGNVACGNDQSAQGGARCLPEAERQRLRLKQGRPLFGVDLEILDDEGCALPHDGRTTGELVARGACVTAGYYRLDDSPLHGGWFPTGDIATIDADGYMQITDRTKDIIRSGGESISSIELENHAMAHPAVAEAAAIAVSHPKWQERPLLVVVRRESHELSRDELLDFLRDKLAKWWLPDDIAFVDSLPHTATGKLSKLALRKQFAGYRLPGVDSA